MDKLPGLLCLFVLASCSSSPVEKKLALADSAVITFNVPDTDSVLKSVGATDVKAIRKLSRFLDGKPMEQYKCGYDGNIIFYRKSEILLPVVFKYTGPDCRHFLYDFDNKTVSRRLNDEASAFLQSLAEGKSWY